MSIIPRRLLKWNIPLFKVDWYFKYYLYKKFGFTFNKMKDQRRYWEKRGNIYRELFFNSRYYVYETFFQDMLIDYLKKLKFDSIFEAGCGFGWNLDRIKDEFPCVKVDGVDFSHSQLKYTTFTYGDIRNMPYKDKSFDVGFSMGVFMNIHPDNVKQAISEMLRVTRKYIIHIEWDENNTTKELREKRICKTNIISHDYRKLYKNVIVFKTYKDFQKNFHFKNTSVSLWEQFEGPEKYIFMVIKV